MTSFGKFLVQARVGAMAGTAFSGDNPASTPWTEPTLRGFVVASTATQAHLNGLGFCTVESL